MTEELNQNGQTIRKFEEQIAELVENIKNLRDADILKSARFFFNRIFPFRFNSKENLLIFFRIKEFELRISRIDEREEDFSRK